MLVEKGLDVGDGLVEGPAVEAVEHGGRHGAFVLRRQGQIGTGHGNGSWHAQLPDSRGPAHRELLRCSEVTSLRDYLSTVSTPLWPENSFPWPPLDGSSRK
ncbi:hypothetical protein GCM10010350_14780 [Streptomyces galilaeus]|nr:hypothetical protein GCM10010350_14780 [Streptomyces galilaeus]